MLATWRIPISISEKRALLQHARTNPSATQINLQHWFHEQHGRVLHKSVISRVLKNSTAIEQAALLTAPTAKKARLAQWPDLEKALTEWITRAQSDIVITGDLIRLKATELWQRLPQY